jgi:hypothetical protein
MARVRDVVSCCKLGSEPLGFINRQGMSCMYVCIYLFTANGPKSGGRIT